MAVDRETGPRKCRRAERAFVEARARINEPAAIARDHLDVSEKMMAERDRLGALQMSEARHDRAGMRQGLRHERFLEAGENLVGRVDRVAHPEAEIRRDLVVAGTRGVEAAGRGADQLGET